MANIIAAESGATLTELTATSRSGEYIQGASKIFRELQFPSIKFQFTATFAIRPIPPYYSPNRVSQQLE